MKVTITGSTSYSDNIRVDDLPPGTFFMKDGDIWQRMAWGETNHAYMVNLTNGKLTVARGTIPANHVLKDISFQIEK